MEVIVAICNVPMIRNGNSRINIGNMVKMTAQSGNAAVPVTIATFLDDYNSEKLMLYCCRNV